MKVLVEQRGDVTIITLNNPEKRNTLSAQLAGSIEQAVREASVGENAQQRKARVILLRAAGSAFCAGADLSGGVYGEDFWGSLSGMIDAVITSPVPVIADVQGPAVGAGCQLLLACDLRVFGDKAACWIPVAQHAFALDTWTIQRAVELLGGSVARNLLLGGARIDAQQALACGFAMGRAVVTKDCDEPVQIATAIAASAPLSMEHSKKVLNHPDPAGDEALVQMFKAVWASDDVKEARRARQERRAVKFHGR